MQLLMNVPFTAVHFSAYETAKKALATEDDENLGVQLVAGGFAGGLSAAFTNPLDVIKTRLQTDGLLRHRRHTGLTAKVPLSIFLCRASPKRLKVTTLWATTVGVLTNCPINGTVPRCKASWWLECPSPNFRVQSAGGILRSGEEGRLPGAPARHVRSSSVPRARRCGVLGHVREHEVGLHGLNAAHLIQLRPPRDTAAPNAE